MDRRFYQGFKLEKAVDALEQYKPDRAKWILLLDNGELAKILRAYASVQEGQYDKALCQLPQHLCGPAEADRLEAKALALAADGPGKVSMPAVDVYDKSVELRTGDCANHDSNYLMQLHEANPFLMLAYAKVGMQRGDAVSGWFAARGHHQTGDFQGAISNATIAKSLPNCNTQTYAGLLSIEGLAYISLGHTQQGLGLMRQAVSIYPHPVVINTYQHELERLGCCA